MRRLLLLGLFLLTGCESIPERAPEGLGLVESLRTWGSVTVIEPAGNPHVVIIADRHAIGTGIGYLPEGHRFQQKEQACAVGHLVRSGFTLLGAELELGALPNEGAAREHRESIESALADGDDLDRWSHFQPLRFAVTWSPRLTVWGVEDAALYAADVRDLDAILDIRSFRRQREGNATPTEDELDRREAALKARIRSHVTERGRAAAKNLLALAESRGDRMVILMLGAAHCGAAAGECAATGAAVTLFTPRSLRK